MYRDPGAVKRNLGFEVQIYRVPLRCAQARNAIMGPFISIHYFSSYFALFLKK